MAPENAITGTSASAKWNERVSALLKKSMSPCTNGTANATARTPPMRQIARGPPTPSETIAYFVMTKYCAPSRAPGVKSAPRTLANTMHSAKLPRPSGNSV